MYVLCECFDVAITVCGVLLFACHEWLKGDGKMCEKQALNIKKLAATAGIFKKIKLTTNPEIPLT